MCSSLKGERVRESEKLTERERERDRDKMSKTRQIMPV